MITEEQAKIIMFDMLRVAPLCTFSEFKCLSVIACIAMEGDGVTAEIAVGDIAGKVTNLAPARVRHLLTSLRCKRPANQHREAREPLLELVRVADEGMATYRLRIAGDRRAA